MFRMCRFHYIIYKPHLQLLHWLIVICVDPACVYIWKVDGCFVRQTTNQMTLSDGCLGSGNDEERSEMRYVMRIAEFSESSNL